MMTNAEYRCPVAHAQGFRFGNNERRGSINGDEDVCDGERTERSISYGRHCASYYPAAILF